MIADWGVALVPPCGTGTHRPFSRFAGSELALDRGKGQALKGSVTIYVALYS
jgi:hypothetical protein